MIGSANADDAGAISPLVKELWPEHSIQNLTRILLLLYISDAESFVALSEDDGEINGVALCTLRHDYVDGEETSPVGYLEGIFVSEEYRKQGIARTLVNECQKWAKGIGCREFASDCELTNTQSLDFHLSIGFNEENRIICFRKVL